MLRRTVMGRRRERPPPEGDRDMLRPENRDKATVWIIVGLVIIVALGLAFTK
jgi:hypothetical protein